MTKRMKLSHQIAYVLSVNVITKDGNDMHLKQFPIVQLTRWLLIIWQIKGFVSVINYKWHMLKMSVKQSVIVICKLVSIGYISLVWGIAL